MDLVFSFHSFLTVITLVFHTSVQSNQAISACQNIMSKEYYNSDWKEHKINLKLKTAANQLVNCSFNCSSSLGTDPFFPVLILIIVLLDASHLELGLSLL